MKIYPNISDIINTGDFVESIGSQQIVDDEEFIMDSIRNEAEAIISAQSLILNC